MRALYVCTSRRNGGWLAESLAADSAADVQVIEAVGGHRGMTRLREEAFDAVLLCHEPGTLDAWEFVEGLRAGGSEDPVVVLGDEPEGETSALAYEVGADAYLCAATATTRTLIWSIARAVERCRLVREHRRLAQAEQRRLRQEHTEAQRLLDQQRGLIRDLEALRDPAAGESAEDSRDARHALARTGASPPLPSALVAHYRDMLRAYVMMGTGNLGGDMGSLAELLVTAGVSGPETMQLHVQALEELVRGLGSRSSRHVMTRADMLALEVMLHLAEGYRLRSQVHSRPARQQSLPGFDAAA
jgi:DNA-binding NarL/FixJ family response regulator